MEFEVMLFLGLFVGSVMLLTGLIWVLDRTTLVPSAIPSRVDPVMGQGDRVAVHDTTGPYISMPETLCTRNEMVAWMTQDLPRLMAAASNPRAADWDTRSTDEPGLRRSKYR